VSLTVTLCYSRSTQGYDRSQRQSSALDKLVQSILIRSQNLHTYCNPYCESEALEEAVQHNSSIIECKADVGFACSGALLFNRVCLLWKSFDSYSDGRFGLP
jgi:hypothetical protein